MYRCPIRNHFKAKYAMRYKTSPLIYKHFPTHLQHTHREYASCERRADSKIKFRLDLKRGLLLARTMRIATIVCVFLSLRELAWGVSPLPMLISFPSQTANVSRWEHESTPLTLPVTGLRGRTQANDITTRSVTRRSGGVLGTALVTAERRDGDGRSGRQPGNGTRPRGGRDPPWKEMERSNELGGGTGAGWVDC